MNYNKIKDIAAQKNMPISALCKEIGMTESGFYMAVKNKSFKVRTIEDIANILGVSPVIFFNESGDSTNINQASGLNTGTMNQNVRVGNLSDCQKELERAYDKITSLEQRLNDKEEMIKSKDEVIALLREKR
ncbi:helix-turn-helix transcriptional regulator [Xanthocytophaga agilis]|uniref:Helix-turn-helix transcriptional regulator n=1 Tax=Xanthocytophaga agilis TaxID=3048010 RepID=A0AAE3R2N0_9BACT|nr:helix-turn-helix transcriptional regulator [Xanthocytophaga agilis]MDJ1500509.1 helix-turn-helix transcriptional regulator [Xanthocytophaga agilis]